MSTPRQPDPRFLPPTPFSRLVVAHALSAAADAILAASLAGSLFFQKPGDSARGDILLYLLLTMAPFAVVSPIIGPALDRIRGGRRLLVVLSCIGRAVLCLLMARYITKPSPEGLLIYPFAFGVLVLAKGYSVARSALVPALIDDESELVRANSRLALISGIMAAVGGAPAFGIQELFGAEWSLLLAVVVFVVAMAYSTKIPKTRIVLDEEEKELEREELHQPSILLAGSAMGVMRAAVGFLAFFVAFALKDDLVGLGFAATMAIVGGFVGNLSTPLVRERFREETILASSIAFSAALVLVAALLGGTLGFVTASLAVAVGAAAGRLGLDSLLQRDGPDAVRGQAFARFETRFQLAWVGGALVGIVPLDAAVGLLGLAGVLIFAGLSYIGALRAARGRVYRTTIRPRMVDRAFGVALERAKDEIRGRRSRGRRRCRRGPGSRGAPTREVAADQNPMPDPPRGRARRS